jgi:proliferating cell nuclear antigen PCNA
MMITPNDSVLFRAAVEALKEFLPEAQLVIKPTGISICGMDRAHVGFVDYFLAKSDCKILQVSGSQTVGINMVNLYKVLANVGASDTICMSLNKTHDRFVVNYTNEKIGKKAVFELPLMTITEDAIELPDLAYAAKVTAKTCDIVGVMKEVGAFGDSMMLTLNSDGFHISASGDIGSAKQTLENTEDRDMELTEDSVVASFATKYVNGIMKGGAPLSPNTVIEFDESSPLRISFHYGNESHFIAYLAPKIIE